MADSSRGVSGIRAAWQDSQLTVELQQADADRPVLDQRAGFDAGQWPGAPADRLPPDCPVTPLGVDGKTSFFVDTLGQLQEIAASEWSKKQLLMLFALQPNYLNWAWPRWGRPQEGKPNMNGLETDNAIQCLMKAAAQRGIFSPIDKVRGRGGWADAAGGFVWHSGDALWRVEGKRLEHSPPGEVDGIFYPKRPPVTRPWAEPVPVADSPAHGLLRDMRSWTWERPDLDPLLVIGYIYCAFKGAALDWRPHIFITGDRGVGKSTLQALIKAVMGDALHAAADTTAAGIYQRVRQDCLPVAIDELEAGADNRKVMAVVNLARLASSGGLMYRGGAEHTGVEFRLKNSFIFAAINPPPLEPQDRSRMAVLNMGHLDASKRRKELVLNADTGRMLLRSLMDSAADYPRLLQDWRGALARGGLDSRGQDTYGTLLAGAHALLGDEAMEDAGFTIENQDNLGRQVARHTRLARADEDDNWRLCLEHLLGYVIDQWRDGVKPSIGHVLERVEGGDWDIEAADARLQLAGVKLRVENADGNVLKVLPSPHPQGCRYLLAVPVSGPKVKTIYRNTKWADGVWASALKQARQGIVISDRKNGQNVKIDRMTQRCVFIDMSAYDAFLQTMSEGYSDE